MKKTIKCELCQQLGKTTINDLGPKKRESMRYDSRNVMFFLYIIRIGELFVVHLLFSIYVDLHVRPRKLHSTHSITYNSDVRANNVPRFPAATHVAYVQLFFIPPSVGSNRVLLGWYTRP